MLHILHAADLHLDAPFAALTAEQARARRSEQRLLLDALADAAIHFSLLSYAAGVAGSRCVALLRERKGPPKGKKEKERE